MDLVVSWSFWWQRRHGYGLHNELKTLSMKHLSTWKYNHTICESVVVARWGLSTPHLNVRVLVLRIDALRRQWTQTTTQIEALRVGEERSSTQAASTAWIHLSNKHLLNINLSFLSTTNLHRPSLPLLQLLQGIQSILFQYHVTLIRQKNLHKIDKNINKQWHDDTWKLCCLRILNTFCLRSLILTPLGIDRTTSTAFKWHIPR